MKCLGRNGHHIISHLSLERHSDVQCELCVLLKTVYVQTHVILSPALHRYDDQAGIVTQHCQNKVCF